MTFMTMALRELSVSMTELLRCDELDEAGRLVKERKKRDALLAICGTRVFFVWRARVVLTT
jgi:hypothetical protein